MVWWWSGGLGDIQQWLDHEIQKWIHCCVVHIGDDERQMRLETPMWSNKESDVVASAQLDEMGGRVTEVKERGRMEACRWSQ